MSNKGLFLFLLRAVLAPLSFGAVGFSIYIYVRWWGTAGQFDPDYLAGNRPGEIVLACFLLVGGLSVLYLALRSVPPVKTLFTDAVLRSTPNSAPSAAPRLSRGQLGADAGAKGEGETDQTDEFGIELPDLEAASQKEALNRTNR